MGTPELELAGGGLPANLTEERRLDVEGRIKACDIEGLPSLAGISSRNALSLLTKSKEEDSRIRERRVLKTGDARRLKAVHQRKRDLRLSQRSREICGVQENSLRSLLLSEARKDRF
ncbi:MAG: hypothetical protein E6K99_04060 [Thaumarchaeota archaeon]|nr:MAG: hypothetical protein E6K99_04060 [Nitrososphaerota archaeon]